MVELGHIINLYEFEDRMGFFMASVITISKLHPRLHIDVINAGLENMISEENTMRKYLTIYKKDLSQDYFREYHQSEVESANTATSLVTVFGLRQIFIRKFGKEADLLAKSFSGTRKNPDSEILDWGDERPREGCRFSYNLIYTFSG